jgi:hypothetical protein
VYYYLKDFDSAGLITAIIEETQIPVNAIFRVEDLVVKRPESVPKEPPANQYWSALKTRSKSSKDSSWKKVIWSSFSATEFRDIKEAFETLAHKIYKILEYKKLYDNFYRGDMILTCNNFEEGDADLRYYNYLQSMTERIGKVGVDVILGLLLENMEKTGPAMDEQLLVENNQILQRYFENEISRLILESSEIKSNMSRENSLTDRTNVIEYHDDLAYQCYFLQDLETLDINPKELLIKIFNCYRVRKYVTFLANLAEFRDCTADQLKSESIKNRAEFLKNFGEDSLNQALLEKFVGQLDFEEFCIPLLSPDLKDFTLDDWRWYEKLPEGALTSVI